MLSSSDAVVEQLRAAVDAALVEMLTGQGAALRHAQPHVHRAVAALARGADQLVTDDAATAVRAAAQAVQAGQPEQARALLVTARGRLARPESRYIGEPAGTGPEPGS